jgi:16S rRNA (adenine1518-N6/adenine1519-N6)-dimethyltransferase
MCALLLDHPNCAGQFVTIQKEVAERLTAKPSTKDYGPLSIIVQAFADVERIGTISPSCFWPQPEVTSAMVAVRPRKSHEGQGGGDELLPIEFRRGFARFVTELFSKRRKQLGTIFGRDIVDWPAGVTADLRSEALTVPQMIELWRLRGEGNGCE